MGRPLMQHAETQMRASARGPLNTTGQRGSATPAVELRGVSKRLAAASDLGGDRVAAARHALRATANVGLDPQAPRVDVSHQAGAGSQAAALGRATAESRGKEGVDRRRWVVPTKILARTRWLAKLAA